MAKKPLPQKRPAAISSAKPSPTKSAKKPDTATVRRPKVKPTGGVERSSAERNSADAPKKRGTVSEAEIRRIDRELLRLINRRGEIVTQELMQQPNPSVALLGPMADEAFWQELDQNNPGPLPASAVRGVFRQVLGAARRKVKVLRAAYLGPQYSFSHLAAIERFGDSADLCPVGTIAAVFEEVNRGHASFGIVPIENSTDGRVVDTLEMFNKLPLRICAEVQIQVHHNLLGRSPRGEITEIYSKPQAFSQCRDWLARNMPQARLIEVTSTSTAAQLARDKAGVGAVASRQAAEEYDLQIIAENIEDNANNVTRFAVIGEDISRPTGNDRTALLLQIPHEPGSLSDALQIFKKNKINLTWIESFPLRGPEPGYQFFLDFEGHATDSRVKRAMSELEQQAVRLELLGSYPRSEPRG